jgi:hypothetical protein
MDSSRRKQFNYTNIHPAQICSAAASVQAIPNRIDICIDPAFALDLMKQAVTIIVQMIAWSVNVF